MNSEEIQSLIKQLKATGLSEEEIMDLFYESFTKGEMDRKDLETLSEAMGYELTDDFKNDPTPDPIASEGAEGMSKEELEDAKEIKPGESPEEFKEKLEGEEVVSEDKPEDSEPKEEIEEKSEAEESKEESESTADEGKEKEEEEGSSEDDDWEKAQQMFKI